MGEMNYPKRLSDTAKKTLSVAALSVLTGLLLSGCAGSSPSPTPADIPGPNPAVSNSSVPVAPPAPKLNAAQEASLKTELKKIDPALDTPRFAENVQQECRMVLTGRAETSQISITKQLFRVSNERGTADETAKKIIAVVKDSEFCKPAS